MFVLYTHVFFDSGSALREAYADESAERTNRPMATTFNLGIPCCLPKRSGGNAEGAAGARMCSGVHAVSQGACGEGVLVATIA